MINILVFPAASGVGQEIYNALKYHKDINVYGANSGSINPGSILYGEKYIGEAPQMIHTDTCIEWLNSIIMLYNIQCIFPAYDDAQLWLKLHETKLHNVRIVTSPLYTVQICRSKKRTYELFDNILRCPTMYPTVESILDKYPVFIKPQCGEGSKGCHIISSKSDMINTLTPEHIILEYLPGDEYTVDCFTDASGIVSFVGARMRSLTRSGISILTECVHDTNNEFRNMTYKINNTLQLVGSWFFQVKRDTIGELCLMEIAPRIAGAMFLYRELGINFPLLSIYAHMEYPTTILAPSISRAVGCKIYNNYFHVPKSFAESICGLYIDLDDTLISHSEYVNPYMISLLYEAKTAQLPVFLITRHKGNIETTLEKACIHKRLFTEIIHIENTSSKKIFIKNKPAIFIDDSFSERKDVSSEDIHVFDIDAYDIVRDIIRLKRVSNE
jgi:hypothetical protein